MCGTTDPFHIACGQELAPNSAEFSAPSEDALAEFAIRDHMTMAERDQLYHYLLLERERGFPLESEIQDIENIYTRAITRLEEAYRDAASEQQDGRHQQPEARRDVVAVIGARLRALPTPSARRNLRAQRQFERDLRHDRLLFDECYRLAEFIVQNDRLTRQISGAGPRGTFPAIQGIQAHDIAYAMARHYQEQGRFRLLWRISRRGQHGPDAYTLLGPGAIEELTTHAQLARHEQRERSRRRPDNERPFQYVRVSGYRMNPPELLRRARRQARRHVESMRQALNVRAPSRGTAPRRGR